MKTDTNKIKYLEIIFFILVALVLLVKLGESSLWEPDEPRYAEAVREMFESGDYLTPHYNYEYRFDKPILYYWFIAGAAKIFGLNDFSIRLPSAIFTFLTVLLIYLMGRRLYGRAAAFSSAVVLSTLFNFVKLGRYAIPDATWIFFITAAFYFFFLGLHEPEKSKQRMYLGYVMISLATISKSPVGAFIPALVFLIYMLLRKDWSLWKRMRVNAGIAIYAVISVPWFAYMLIKYKSAYFNYYFVSDHLSRFFTSDFLRPRPFYYYFQILLGDFLPWTLFLVLAFFMSELKFDKIRDKKSENFTFLIALWAGVILLTFSLSGTKLPHYINPAFPPLALITGIYISKFIEGKNRPGKRFMISQSVVVLTLLILVVFVFIHGHFLIAESMVSPVIYVLAVLPLIISGFLIYTIVRKKITYFIFISGIGILLLYLGVITILMPVYEHTKPVKDISLYLKSIVKPEDEVCLYKTINPAVMYYLEKKVHEIDKPADLNKFIGRNKRIFIVTKARTVYDFENKITVPVYEIKRQARYLPRFTNFFKRPKKAINYELVLLSNRPLSTDER